MRLRSLDDDDDSPLRDGEVLRAARKFTNSQNPMRPFKLEAG
jgi:hypothetical protein